VVVCGQEVIWSKTYGGIGDDGGHGGCQTSDGGYIVAGWTTSFGLATQAYLIKTDSNGDTIWTRTYGDTVSEDGIDVRQTRDRGYVVVGSRKIRPWTWDVYFIKTDSTGGLQWSRTYGGNQDDRGQSVQQTRDGGYIIAGYCERAGFADYIVCLIKTDPEGDTLWTRPSTWETWSAC
jgi:hypothetical protein